MPYFLIGMILKEKEIDLSKIKLQKKWKVLSIIFFMISFLTVYWMNIDFNEVLESGDAEKLTLGLRLIIKKYDTIPSLLIDMAYRTTSIILCFCFLMLVPHKKTFFSKFGQYTLYVYLLHIFIIHFILDLGLKVYSNKPSWWSYIILVSTSIALVPVLSSHLIRRVFKWAISPNLSETPIKIIYQKPS